MKSLFKMWFWALFLVFCGWVFLSMVMGALGSFDKGYYWGMFVATSGLAISAWLVFYSIKRVFANKREIDKNILFNFIDTGARDHFCGRMGDYNIKISEFESLNVFVVEKILAGTSQPLLFVREPAGKLSRKRSFYAGLITSLTNQVRKDFPKKKVRQAVLVNVESVTGFSSKFKEDSFNGKEVLSVKGRFGLSSLFNLVESKLTN